MNCPQCGGDVSGRSVCPQCGAEVVDEPVKIIDASGKSRAAAPKPRLGRIAVDRAASELPDLFRALRIGFLKKGGSFKGATYFSFSGRASRSDFWRATAGIALLTLFFMLTGSLVEILAEFLFEKLLGAFGGTLSGVYVRDGRVAGFYFKILFLILLFTSLPLLRLAMRRYQDVGLSGWIFVGLCALLFLSLSFLVEAPVTLIAASPTGWLILAVNFGALCVVSARYSLFSADVLWHAAINLFIIVNLVVFCWPGTKGPNKYGPAPEE